jgi:hypothetical protein
MEAFNGFVALSMIYLPDAITTLKSAAAAQTLEEARDRVQEADAVLNGLLKLSRQVSSELKAPYRPASLTQEAEAVLKCLLQTSESTAPELKQPANQCSSGSSARQKAPGST